MTELANGSRLFAYPTAQFMDLILTEMAKIPKTFMSSHQYF